MKDASRNIQQIQNFQQGYCLHSKDSRNCKRSERHRAVSFKALIVASESVRTF